MGEKKTKKWRQQQEQAYEGARAHLEAIVDARARAERHVADLADLATLMGTQVERSEAQLRATVEHSETTLRSLVEQTETAVRKLLEDAEAQGKTVEAAHAHATSSADDLAAQIRRQVARVDKAVDAELARLETLRSVAEARVATAAEQAESQIRMVAEECLATFDAARADALDRWEERTAEVRRRLDGLEREFVADAVSTATTPGDLEIEFSDGRPPEPALFEADLAPSERLSWAAMPNEPSGHEQAPDAVIATDAPPFAPAATEPEPLAPVLTASESASRSARPRVSSITFHASRAQLVASLSQLSRTAADGWVRVEAVHRASQGQAVSSLRLTVHDVAGGLEYHDVPGHASSGGRHFITVDAKELRQALEYNWDGVDDLDLTLDDDITVGTVIVLGTNASIPVPSGERRKIERVELQAGGRDGLHLDTLVGRVVVPSRVLSSLRSRRADDISLVKIGDQPWLSARVAGPTPEITATIEHPLAPDIEAADATRVERRANTDSAINQLVSALSTNSSPEELIAIIADGVGYARRRAAAHPALPEGVIAEILRDGTEAMRSAAAANPSIPASSIEIAVADDAPPVRAAVAANPNVAPALLFRLARDDSAEVRARVASNPAIPPEMLTLLADDGDATVRATVAAHPSCPLETLAVLAGDAFPAVCENVATNSNCPAELLDQLLSVVPEVVLSNPRAPERLLVAGSQVGAAKLRAAVAANPATPARELQALARDREQTVVQALATNPNAPSGVRRRARRRGEQGPMSRQSPSET